MADHRFTEGSVNYSFAWILLVIPFFDFFGLHRMFTGKWITSLLYMFTAGLFGLGVLYDFWTLNSHIYEINREENGHVSYR